VDNSGNNFTEPDPLKQTGAVYKGLAIATSATPIFAGDPASTAVLYATNFRSGQVEVYDSAFHRVTLPSSAFSDPSLPPGYAPFDVQVLNGKVYVTYALQNAAKHDEPVTVRPSREVTSRVPLLLKVVLLKPMLERPAALMVPWLTRLALRKLVCERPPARRKVMVAPGALTRVPLTTVRLPPKLPEVPRVIAPWLVKPVAKRAFPGTSGVALGPFTNGCVVPPNPSLEVPVPQRPAGGDEGRDLLQRRAAAGATVLVLGVAEVVVVQVDAGRLEGVDGPLAGWARHRRALDPQQEQALPVHLSQ
jgi:hypothetical protein